MRFRWRTRKSEQQLPPPRSQGTIGTIKAPDPAINVRTSRRSDRILNPIRIRVYGFDASGNTFEEETITVSVNKHGACISLQHMLRPEQEINIQNLENGIATKFRVVGELRQVFGARREWGVETHCPECNIWGLEFESPPDDAQPKVLISCTECKKGTLSPLTSIEYDVLLYTGVISRHCQFCDQTTRWGPSGNPPEPLLIARAVRPVSSPLERRKHRRHNMTMLLRVRNKQGEAETAQTLDVSKGGVRFLSRRTYQVGDSVYVTLPSADKTTPTETRGCIVRAELNQRGTAYGVRFEKD
jgi:PilZ domain